MLTITSRSAAGPAARFGQLRPPVGVGPIQPGQPLEDILVPDEGVLGARVAKLPRDVTEPAVRQPEFLQPVGIVGIQVSQLLEDAQGLGVGMLRGSLLMSAASDRPKNTPTPTPTPDMASERPHAEGRPGDDAEHRPYTAWFTLLHARRVVIRATS